MPTTDQLPVPGDDVRRLQNSLLAFATDYQSNKVPPPHTLLVGSDAGRSSGLAAGLAQRMAVKFYSADASTLTSPGALTAALTAASICFLRNPQVLDPSALERLTTALTNGMLEITIGAGPAVRRHQFPLDSLSVFVSCRRRSECPPALQALIRCVLEVPPYTESELVTILEQQAWEDHHMQFEKAAAAVLLKCSKGDSERLLEVYRKALPFLDQAKTTNRPYIYRSEVELALRRCRIEVPPDLPHDPTIPLQSLSGQQFEQLIQELLLKMGFEAELTEVTGDGGIDIVATLNRPFCGGTFLFQCKRFNETNTVGSPTLREFYGAVSAHRTVNKGIFITTSDFSTQAREFAEANNIELVNGQGLQQLLEEVGMTKYA